jgi:hypothetical protein
VSASPPARDYDEYPSRDDIDAWVALAEAEIETYGVIRNGTASQMPPAAMRIVTLRAVTRHDDPTTHPSNAPSDRERYREMPRVGHVPQRPPPPSTERSGPIPEARGPQTKGRHAPPWRPPYPTHSRAGSARQAYLRHAARNGGDESQHPMLGAFMLLVKLILIGAILLTIRLGYDRAIQEHIAAHGDVPAWTVPQLRPEASDRFWGERRDAAVARGQPTPVPLNPYQRAELERQASENARMAAISAQNRANFAAAEQRQRDFEARRAANLAKGPPAD